MKQFLYLALGVSALLCAIGFLRVAAALESSIIAMPAILSMSIERSADNVAKQLVGSLGTQVEGLRGDLVREAWATRGATVALVSKAISTADKRLGETTAALDRSVRVVEQVGGRLNPVLHELSSVGTASGALLGEGSLLLGEGASLLRQVNAAAPLILDCDHNPNCAFNRYVGTAKAIEVTAQETAATMKVVREASPRIVRSFEATTGNVERITRPASIAERLLRLAGPVAGGAVMGAIVDK